MALTFTNRGTGTDKTNSNLAIGFNGAVSVGELILVAVTCSGDGVFANQVIGCTDAHAGTANLYEKVMDIQNSTHSRVMVFASVCKTALTGSDTVTINWGVSAGNTAPSASAGCITKVTPNNAGRGWAFALTPRNSLGNNGTSMSLSVTTDAGASTSDSFLFCVVGRQINTATFNAGTGFTAGQTVGTSGGVATSNQRLMVEWRTVAASTSYDGAPDFGASSADNSAIMLEIVNQSQFIVGQTPTKIGGPDWTYIPPGIRSAVISGLRLRSALSSAALATGVISAAFKLSAKMTSSGHATGVISGAKIKTTMLASGVATAVIGGYNLLATIHATGIASASATCTMVPRLRSSFSASATASLTAAPRLRSTMTAAAAASLTAAVRLRSTFGNITAFSLNTMVGGKLRTTMLSSAVSVNSAAVRLRSTFLASASVLSSMLVHISAVGLAQGTANASAAVNLRSSFVGTTGRATAVLAGGRLRSSFISAAISVNTLATGGFLTATLVSSTATSASLRATLRSSCTITAGAGGTMAPRLRSALSASGASAGALAHYRLRSSFIALGNGSGVIVGGRLRSSALSTPDANGVITGLRLRSTLQASAHADGAMSPTLRSSLIAQGISVNAAAVRLRSTMLSSAHATGTMITLVSFPLSGSITASPSPNTPALAVMFALTGGVTVTGSLATATLPVAYRLASTLSGTASLVGALLGALPINGTLSVTASLTGLLGRLLQISSPIGATLALNTPILGVSVALGGSVTATASINAPTLQVHAGNVVTLNGIITVAWVLSNPALDADQFARSPPDRTIIIPAEDRLIINEA